MHAIYHCSFPPKVVDDDEYHQLLEGGEWFDRPQINLKGNSDETKWLLNGKKGRSKSGSQLSGARCSLSDGEFSRKPDVEPDVQRYDEKSSGTTGVSRNEHGERPRDGVNVTSLDKKRGRPKKIVG